MLRSEAGTSPTVDSTQRGIRRHSSIPATVDPAQAWHAHDRHLRELLADPAVADLEYDGVFGRSTIGAAITTFYGFDLIVHRWDLAQSAGHDETRGFGEEASQSLLRRRL